MTAGFITLSVRAAIFTVVSFFIFYGGLNSYFISDDWHWLSLASQQASMVPNFLSNYEGTNMGGSYNPMASLWFKALYDLFGLNQFAYHLGSMVLHGFFAAVLVKLVRVLFLAFGRSASEVRFVSYGAALLFLVWPNNVEAVLWISAVPHLLSAVFYVIALLYYVRGRLQDRWLYVGLSSIAAFAACLSKESAVSIVLAFILLEFFLPHTPQRTVKQGARLLFAVMPIGLFLVLRYIATGLVFGSYAEATFVVRPLQIVNTIATFFVDFISAGLMRVSWMTLYWSNPSVSAVVVGVVGLGVVICAFIYRKRVEAQTWIAVTLGCITILPFLPLGFSRVSSEGERYSYLSTAFFLIVFFLLLQKIKSRSRKYIIIILLCFFAASITMHKVKPWAEAGKLSKKILDEVVQVVSLNDTNYIIALPDTIDGAQVFRNNIREALSLTSDMNSLIVHIPVYQILAKRNYQNSQLSWTTDKRGFFGISRDKNFIVTGFDRRETDDYIYELWNYDYSNFTSDTIRLIFKGEALEKFNNGTAHLIVWDGVEARVIPYLSVAPNAVNDLP